MSTTQTTLKNLRDSWPVSVDVSEKEKQTLIQARKIQERRSVTPVKTHGGESVNIDLDLRQMQKDALLAVRPLVVNLVQRHIKKLQDYRQQLTEGAKELTDAIGYPVSISTEKVDSEIAAWQKIETEIEKKTKIGFQKHIYDFNAYSAGRWLHSYLVAAGIENPHKDQNGRVQFN